MKKRGAKRQITTRNEKQEEKCDVQGDSSSEDDS